MIKDRLKATAIFCSAVLLPFVLSFCIAGLQPSRADITSGSGGGGSTTLESGHMIRWLQI